MSMERRFFCSNTPKSASCHPDRRTQASVILTERSERKDLQHRLTLSSKEEWKTAHANKKRIRCLFHSSFLCPDAVTSSGSFVGLRASEGICHPDRAKRAEGSGGSKTVGKRKTFSAFSFFDIPLLALFLFLSMSAIRKRTDCRMNVQQKRSKI